jgi:mevalonate kinase
MRAVLIIVLMYAASYSGFCQSTTPKYQVGTITEVKRHTEASGSDSSVSRYDISIRVGDTIYVVLYTLPPGKLSPEYRAGSELSVLVASQTIKFNDMLGRPMEVPIMQRKTVPAQTRQ